MSKTGKFLNPRNGGVSDVKIPSWKRQQAEAMRDHESDRKSHISPASAKNERDSTLEKIVFSDMEIGQIQSELLEVWGEL